MKMGQLLCCHQLPGSDTREVRALSQMAESTPAILSGPLPSEHHSTGVQFILKQHKQGGEGSLYLIFSSLCIRSPGNESIHMVSTANLHESNCSWTQLAHNSLISTLSHAECLYMHLSTCSHTHSAIHLWIYSTLTY